jgi:hypothetical protein
MSLWFDDKSGRTWSVTRYLSLGQELPNQRCREDGYFLYRPMPAILQDHEFRVPELGLPIGATR